MFMNYSDTADGTRESKYQTRTENASAIGTCCREQHVYRVAVDRSFYREGLEKRDCKLGSSRAHVRVCGVVKAFAKLFPSVLWEEAFC